MVCRRFCLLLLIAFFPLAVVCQPSAVADVAVAKIDPQGEYVHLPREEIPMREKWANFAFMYGLQWGVYFLTQEEIIREHGSFENMTRNFGNPHFDRDSFDYNLFKHSLVGQYYYQFYRARGYNEKDAFFWSFSSSLAFEFAIETMTERPSYQDIYQTPVFGTVLGMGFERLSLYFHSKKTWPYWMLGYLLNPFTIFSGARYGFTAVPVVQKDHAGVLVSWGFP